ncbi:hypothetical protein AB7Z32_40125 [Bradyrhizobium sp. 482_C4_N1_1]|uniref:hypothetical protein n=1 Tax=unclassified Bradyrhizobium TaxID=2631580 RepID=UPI003F8C1CE2
MNLSALQGSALVRVVDDLKALITSGEVASQSLRALSAPRDAGLWLDDGARLVATSQLVSLANVLPTYSETLPAIFSLFCEQRAAWLRIVLARLREIGERNDVAGLCGTVTASGPLAAELIAGVIPSLAETRSGELERLVLPAAAHEAQAFPVLLRALAATAGPVKSPPTSVGSIPGVVWDDPSKTWQPGRLIRLPSLDDTAPAAVVLSGALDDRIGDGDSMRWVLQRPWAFLLSQMVFTKEAWEAERVSGGLAFELEHAHVALFQNPPRVNVVVTLPTGEEVQCGSLGEFVLETLAQLDVTVLAHRVSAAVLDDRLASVVEVLVRREVWRFDHGSGGRSPGYTIHPSFSDACYRALGSRAFYRLGSHITAAVRRVAETWARGRVGRAGGFLEKGATL